MFPRSTLPNYIREIFLHIVNTLIFRLSLFVQETSEPSNTHQAPPTAKINVNIASLLCFMNVTKLSITVKFVSEYKILLLFSFFPINVIGISFCHREEKLIRWFTIQGWTIYPADKHPRYP